MVIALWLLAAGLLFLVLGAVSHTFSFGHSGGSVSLSDQATASGEIAIEANIALAATTTDQQEAIAFAYASLQGIYIKSDVAVTLETNATNHASGDIIQIAAGVPFVWIAGAGITNPFAFNVTTTYWTNATGGAATIYVRILVS